MVQTMVRQVVPLQPMEEPHTGAGLVAGLVTLWVPMLEPSVPKELHAMEGTHTGLREECEKSSL